MSETAYVWSDGTGLDYINWETGEPGNDTQSCVEMLTNKGTWVDVACTTKQSYLCKTKKIPNKYTTLSPTSKPGRISTGGVVGIVISVMVAVTVLAFLVYTYAFKTRARPSRTSHTQIDGTTIEYSSA
ncbi:hypothetical protein OTU49_008937 [Cherax quadricarinatus]|uniref:C-type lectin domain-containing protein n=1 Tax=Cherax quadricarinatus TaxID=27406 RepID=A0AAW0WLU6_CHEQU